MTRKLRLVCSFEHVHNARFRADAGKVFGIAHKLAMRVEHLKLSHFPGSSRESWLFDRLVEPRHRVEDFAQQIEEVGSYKNCISTAPPAPRCPTMPFALMDE